MQTINILDVTIIEPKLKHPVIFQQFDLLIEGDAFIIHNDHDPKPLYYQLIGERGNIFSWEYIESGPDFWKVKIAKNNLLSELTIGEIVAKDFRKADVFKKYNLDFCCGGNKTVTQACNAKKIDYMAVESELNKIDAQALKSTHKFDEWKLDFLVDYILNTHHEYVKKSIPILLEYVNKVSKVHGYSHPEVIEIADIFYEAAEELKGHMYKEEQILFPYIKQLINKKLEDSLETHCAFGSIQNPINMMEHEHDVVGNMFKTIRKLSNDYIAPNEACSTYKVSYLKLKEFEEDLHQHIHLENNILFPKSILLESLF